ncbi:MAG: hypothetical protein HZA54_14875 [Planctomycetes bacterium]|nr:hypothetical protein [Planctomycetota bacterium]
MLQTQADFQPHLSGLALMGAGGGQGADGDWFGNLVATGPNAVWAGLAPDTSTAADKGEVRLANSQDQRGNPKFRESFDATLEGMDLGKGAIGYPPGAVVPAPLPGQDIGSGGFEAWWKPESAPATATYLDVAQGEWMNRLHLSLENGSLVISTSDAGADELGAQVRAPFTPEAGRWHHIGAYWKTNLPGHLLLAIDGIPAGSFTYWSGKARTAVMSALSGPLDAGTTSIPLTSPWARQTGGTVIEIGGEAIEMPAAGTAVRGARGTTAAEHPAGSLVSPFGYANPVAAYNINLPGAGGQNRFALDRIPRTSGRVREAFGVNTACLIRPGPPRPPNQPGFRIADMTLNVLPLGGAATATADFPDRGYLIIGMPGAQEVVFYDGKTDTSFAIGTNGRGVTLPTVTGAAQDHPGMAPVFLFSIPVDNMSNYASPGSQACLVEIDDEWFIGTPFDRASGAPPAPLPPGQPPAGASADTFLVGCTNAGVFYLPPGVATGFGRAFAYSTHAAHAPNAAALPVFAVRDGPVRAPGPPGTPGAPYGQMAIQFGGAVVQATVDVGRAGPGDVVTLAEAEPQALPKEQATVHNARSIRVAVGTSFQNFVNLVSLRAPVARDYVAAPNGSTRLLKFPSGEMPCYTPGQTWVGRSEDLARAGPQGIVGGLIDEIRFHSSPRGDFRISKLCGSGDATVLIEVLGGSGVSGFLGAGGAFKVEDEVIAYTAARAAGQRTDSAPSGAPVSVGLIELTGCGRGFLGTRAAGHGIGARVFNLPFFPVGVLDGGVGAGEAAIALAAPAQGAPGRQGFPREGYVLVDSELIGYVRDSGNTLSIPAGKDGQGLWRGAFGTTAAAHASGAFACALPFRFWDRWKKGADDDSMAYYQFARAATGALWRRLSWTDQRPDRHCGVRALGRLDGRPAWDSPPTNRAGGIWEFTDGAARNRLDTRGDRIEVRFVFDFAAGAYADGAWTDTAAVRSVRVDYEQPQVVHSRLGE